MFTQFEPGVIYPFGVAPVLRELAGLVAIAALPQSEENIHFFIGSDIEMNLERRTRVAIGPHSIAQAETTQTSGDVPSRLRDR